jgi:iron complex outermembrane recepter protein
MKINNQMFRAIMLSTISIASLGLGSAAYAQQDPQPEADSAEEEAGSDNNEIIVTATKREQTLQDVPISVSVTTADTIERAQVRDLLDLQTLVPSLKVGQQQSSANTNFIIRGFGNGANNAGIEPSVGVFIDGVYRSRSAAQIGDLPNIRRVEVLRGPQSTLFGKNASAGIISIVTAEPQFEFGGGIEASYGNFDAVVIKGDVTGPISETLAFSLAGNYNKRDGYVNVVNLGTKSNDRNRYGVRGQLLWEPSDTLKVRLIGDYDKIDEVCCGVVNLVNGPTGAIVNQLAGGVGLDANDPFSYDVYQNLESVNKIKNYGVSGQIDFDLTDSLSLTSISAYRSVRSKTNQDSDFTSADLLGENSQNLKIDTFTQEIRLASNFDGPLNFLIGGFYFNEKIDQANVISFGSQFRPYGNALIQAATGGALNVATLEGTFGALEGNPARYVNSFFRAGNGLNEAYDLSNKSYSLFGTVDFEIAEGLILTGGLNYTDDSKRFSTDIVSTDVFSGINFNAAAYTPFRQALLIGGGVDPATAAFLAANPTFNAQANPLNGLRPLQFLPAFLNVPNAVESGRTDDNKLTYTARLAYKASNNLSVYGTYATGFKASSINLSRDSRPTAADLVLVRSGGFATTNLTSGSRFAAPENATVYEIGVKGSWEGFGFNLAVFKQVLKGFQSNVFTGTGFVLGNAEKQSTKGFEFDATISPVRGLNFTASYTYLDPKYDRFTGGSAYNPLTNLIVPADLTGLTPSAISKHSIAVGGTYSLELTERTGLIFHADYALNSGYPFGQGLAFEANIESLNASLALKLDNGLEMSIWGRNLTEPQYNAAIFPAVAQSGSLSAYPPPPRTYGVSAKFDF